MGTTDSTSTTRASQMTPDELTALARRLRARAESVVLRDSPHQQSDLLAAAQVIDQLVQLHAEILASGAAIDGLTRLLDVMGGA